MKTVRLVCPNCHSPDFAELPDQPDRYRCRHCTNIFAITAAVREDSPLPAQGSRPASARAGMGVALAAFAITAIVIAGAVTGLVLSRSRPRRYTPTSYEATTPVRPADPVEVPKAEIVSAKVEPELQPAAEVRNVRHAESSGFEVWVGEVVNTGPIAIERPCVRAVMKDAKGEVLGDQRAYPPRSQIGKGDSAPFRITQKKTPYASLDMVLCDVRAVSSWSTREAPAKVVQQKFVRGDYGSSVIGEVENPGTTALQFVQVTVMGRDDQGNLLSVDEGYADVKDLAPGKRSAFKVMTGIFSTGTVTRYDAFAYGMPK